MCDFTFEPGGREAAMVTIARDETGKPTAWCDPCLVDTIKALNTNGLKTTASCCGHYNHVGWVMLEDGRTIFIYPNHDEALRAGTATAGRLSTHSDVNVSCNCEGEKPPVENALSALRHQEAENGRLSQEVEEIATRLERIEHITADDVFAAYCHANKWVESEFEAIAKWVHSVAAGGPIRPPEWSDEEQSDE